MAFSGFTVRNLLSAAIRRIGSTNGRLLSYLAAGIWAGAFWRFLLLCSYFYLSIFCDILTDHRSTVHSLLSFMILNILSGTSQQ
jgi:hypothetical protein